MKSRKFAHRVLVLLSGVGMLTSLPVAAAPPTYGELLATLPDSDWVRPDPADTLYLDLEGGRVVIALSNDYAPRHAANLRSLARAHYFDGLSVTRVQDNYVTQWGNDAGARPLPPGVTTLAPEFERAITPALPFTKLKDGDVYAPAVGHSRGFPVARDPASGRTWLAHCYAMVGVGRDLAADSGSGEELYVVIGHAPRHLDRNVTLVGRVLSGMELLSEMPRGTAQMGMYAPDQARPRVLGMTVAADVPAAQRVPIEMFNTEAADYQRLVESRRNRHDGFVKVLAGRIDLCNAPLPARMKAAATP